MAKRETFELEVLSLNLPSFKFTQQAIKKTKQLNILNIISDKGGGGTDNIHNSSDSGLDSEKKRKKIIVCDLNEVYLFNSMPGSLNYPRELDKKLIVVAV